MFVLSLLLLLPLLLSVLLPLLLSVLLLLLLLSVLLLSVLLLVAVFLSVLLLLLLLFPVVTAPCRSPMWHSDHSTMTTFQAFQEMVAQRLSQVNHIHVCTHWTPRDTSPTNHHRYVACHYTLSGYIPHKPPSICGLSLHSVGIHPPQTTIDMWPVITLCRDTSPTNHHRYVACHYTLSGYIPHKPPSICGLSLHSVGIHPPQTTIDMWPVITLCRDTSPTNHHRYVACHYTLFISNHHRYVACHYTLSGYIPHKPPSICGLSLHSVGIHPPQTTIDMWPVITLCRDTSPTNHHRYVACHYTLFISTLFSLACDISNHLNGISPYRRNKYTRTLKMNRK